MKKKVFVPIFLLLFSLLAYLPLFANPNLLLNRGNDLQEQFWPVFYFIRLNFLKTRQLPLWNNLFLSGTPILPDPQFSLFYPLNIVFLLLPTDAAFIIHFIIHSFLGSIGAYLLARQGIKLSKTASLVTALFYLLTPKLAGYMEAGHFGLAATLAWLPFVLLSFLKLTQKPRPGWVVLLAVSSAALFYTHTIIFGLALIALTIMFVFLKPKNIFSFLAAILVTFGLIAITFLPQLEWAPHTTRFLLTEKPDVYPKWNSVTEFFLSLFLPWISGKEGLWAFDSEKWLPLGIFVSFFSLTGFLTLKRKAKILTLIPFVISILLLSNNISPFYPILLNQKWYALMRVSTRFWFILFMMVIILAGLGLDSLIKKRVNKKILSLIVILAVVESLTLSWLRLQKPFSNVRFAPQEIYQFLAEDKEKFRVFCISRCLSQKEAAKFGLELIEGYNTLQQLNYFKHSWQLMGGYWDYYTLAIPPIGSYESLQLDAKSLGEYNTKYVISRRELTDKEFVFEKRFGNYLVYSNKLFQPRANAPIVFYSPNHIRFDTSNLNSHQLIISEVYNSGWKAYLDSKEKALVQETPIALRAVDIKPDTKFVDLHYKPKSFILGTFISIFTVFSIFASWIYSSKKKARNSAKHKG